MKEIFLRMQNFAVYLKIHNNRKESQALEIQIYK
jgi:hypothetical protein